MDITNYVQTSNFGAPKILSLILLTTAFEMPDWSRPQPSSHPHTHPLLPLSLHHSSLQGPSPVQADEQAAPLLLFLALVLQVSKHLGEVVRV